MREDTCVLNLWEDLPAMAVAADSAGRASDSAAEDEDFNAFSPLPRETATDWVELDGPHKRIARYAEDGVTLLQMDHFRSDGSLLLSDRHDVKQPGLHGGRSLTMCGLDGLPLQEWGSAWGLYRSWLDYLISDSTAYFIVDNKNTARFMASYRRENAVVMYQIHENHLKSSTGEFSSELTPSAEEVFPRLDSFDGVVYLTEQQAVDVHKRYADTGKTYIVPNGRSTDVYGGNEAGRSPRLGIQAATLSHRKRVDHAIKAVHLANKNLADKVQLRIYGDGSQRANLEQLLVELDAAVDVKLMGHVPNAQQHFRGASFSLLTSTSEAFGLVIVESMAAGCIPIVYDLRYGPASIITDGVDGFLVEYGDIDALAKCISDFVSLPEERIQQMRAAAQKRATDFSDANVVKLWGAAITHAATRKRINQPRYKTEISTSACEYRAGGELEVRAHVRVELVEASSLEGSPRFFCRIRIRPGEAFFRVAASSQRRVAPDTYSLGFVFEPRILETVAGQTVDVFLETRLQGTTKVTRMPLAEVRAAPRFYATAHGNMSISFA
ncbi:glycosyltransferase [Arthrobacter sp. A5]|uniref:glycosyltransferase n=1 Tax=Arthrobacter sp. A5 TaxID=576926 RepID=UPI003DA9C1A5